MRIHYTGRKADISEPQKRKIEAKFEKCHKILGKRHNLEAHVVLSRQRHLHEAEVTLRALNHTLVVSASRVDCFAALQGAVDKLEKQVVRNKHKLIDTRRQDRKGATALLQSEAETAASADSESDDSDARKGRVARVVRGDRINTKPMTVEEALIRIEELNRDQLTYRDAESGELRVLLRRRDGNLELIEAG
jgi:putative sigma-54 modulation protein